MTKKSIEDVFRETFEDFEAEVKPAIWTNIQTGLKGIGLGFLGKFIINKIGTNTAIAVISSATTVIATVLVMNLTGNSAKKTNSVSENQKPATTAISGSEKAVTNINNTSASTNSVAPAEIKESAKPILEIKQNNTSNNSDNGTSIKEEMHEQNIVVKTKKLDKQKFESVIKDFSTARIASIFASPIGGTVPLIVNLSNNGNGKICKWTFSDGKKDDKSANPVHVFETPGNYTVILTSSDETGKTGIDSLKIEVTGNSSMSSAPATFTPNGDGVSDVFLFQSKNIVKMNAQIFDQKGKVVYQWDGIGGRWDGTDLMGNEVKDGTYFYLVIAEGVDKKKYEQKGAILLTR